MKKVFGLLIVSSGLLLGYFAFMQESAIAQQTCPNVSGLWKRADGNGTIWNFTQNLCTLGGTSASSPFQASTSSGVFFDNRTADFVINSSSIFPYACQIKQYATLTVLSVPNLIRINVYSTEGKCDTRQKLIEDYVYTKF